VKNSEFNLPEIRFSDSQRERSKRISLNSNLTRRQFVEKSLIGSAGLVTSTAGLMAQPAQSKNIAASDKIILGVIGLGDRDCFLIQQFIKQGAEVAYICDVDTRRYVNGLNACKGQIKSPKTVQDFRLILDDKSVTAMIIGPGTHWAPLATIMACQSGKDVYVEKPMSHDVYEGRKMVEAAHKYNRIVQAGCQNRSGAYHEKAIEFLKAGKIGKIHYIRVLNMLDSTLGSPGPYPEMPVPKEVDYDMWCGPAPKNPYNTKKTKSVVWRYFWDYSGGDSESIHQIDIARWVTSALIGQDYPKTIYSVGAVKFPDRVAEIPDSMTTIYDYGDITLLSEITWWTPYLIKIPEEIRFSETLFPNWQFTGTRIEIYGNNGMMYLGRHGGGWQTFGANGEWGPQLKGIMPIVEHIANFLDCIRTRKSPNGEIEKAHISQSISHMAYISYRVGNQLLKLDGSNERFIDNIEANKLLARSDGGRAPWKIPNQV
jgi:predicted dehydrogenase